MCGVHSAASFDSAFQAFMNASASIHTNQLLFSALTKTPSQAQGMQATARIKHKKNGLGTVTPQKKKKQLTPLLTKTQHKMSPPRRLPLHLILPRINIQIQPAHQHAPRLALHKRWLQRVGVDEGGPDGGALEGAAVDGGGEAGGGGGFVAVEG